MAVSQKRKHLITKSHDTSSFALLHFSSENNDSLSIINFSNLSWFAKMRTWNDSSTLNEEFCQNTKKINLIVEESCQQLLENRASDCWRIVPATVEQSCQRQFSRNHDCSTVTGTIVRQSLTRLFNSHRHDSSTVNVTVEEFC